MIDRIGIIVAPNERFGRSRRYWVALIAAWQRACLWRRKSSKFYVISVKKSLRPAIALTAKSRIVHHVTLTVIDQGIDFNIGI